MGIRLERARVAAMIAGRRVGVFAAMSLDGHLAEPNDGLDFLASVQREDEDYG